MSIFLSSFSPENRYSALGKQYDTGESLQFIKKKVNVTITSTNGCSVHIVGVVTFTLFPPEITDFDGTVTIGGPGHCPHVTLTFQKTAGADLQITPNSDDPCAVTDVSWTGSDGDVVNILNEGNSRNVITQELQLLCES